MFTANIIVTFSSRKKNSSTTVC